MNNQTYTKSIAIHATPEAVWDALTNVELMPNWMSEKEIRITTSWKPGSNFLIEGELSGIPFQNTGMVLDYKPQRAVSYSHLSSLSGLANNVKNYTLLEFVLTTKDNHTNLEFTAWNFPSDSIYQHFAFYWNVALEMLKKFIEEKK